MAAAHRARKARDVVHFLHHDEPIFFADDFMIAPAACACVNEEERECRSEPIDPTVGYVPKKFAEGIFFSRKGFT